MQKIERYGVIALVFLLVTIVAVSFWGDSKSPGFWSRLTGRGAKKEAPVDPTANMIPPASSTERAIDPSLPLTDTAPASTGGTTAAPVAAATKDPWTTTPSVPTAPPEIAGPGSAAAPAPAPTMMGNSLASAEVQNAPRPQPATTATPPTGKQYVVQKGDSLTRIAARTLGSGSRWTEIQSLNAGLDPHTLRPGMKIVLPASAKVDGSPATSTASGAPAKAAPKSAPANSTGTYVVRAGDTLTSIATRLLGSKERWREIVAANPGLDPKHLLVGKSIRVPMGAEDAVRKDDTRTAAARPSATRAPELAAAEPRTDRPHVR